MLPRLIRTLLTLTLLSCALLTPRASRADARPGPLRIGADVGVGGGIRYRREVSDSADTLTPRASGQAALSVHYMFSRYVGLGAQVSGAVIPARDDDTRATGWAIDIGPSPTLRLPLDHLELTLRAPFGLTLGASGAKYQGAVAERLGIAVNSVSSSMGPGAHVAGLAGCSFWVSPGLALHLETGPFWRMFRAEEGGSVSTNGLVLTVDNDTEVKSRVLTWLVQLGIAWAPR